MLIAELALTDLELGRIMPTSSGISPISTPPIVSHRLQIQFGNDILICSETSMECQLWIEGKDERFQDDVSEPFRRGSLECPCSATSDQLIRNQILVT